MIVKHACTGELSIPVSAQSKAWICGRSSAEIVGSNPTGGMDVCLLWVLCVVRERPLRRAEPSSRGVLPTVVRRCVWSRNLKNEDVLAHRGLLCKNIQTKNWRINKFGNENDIISSNSTDTSSSGSSRGNNNNNNTVYSRTLILFSAVLEACISQIVHLNNMRFSDTLFRFLPLAQWKIAKEPLAAEL